MPSFDVNGEMRVAFRIIGLTGGKTNMKKRSNEMKAGTGAKSSFGCSSAGNATKAPAKGNVKQKTKWNILAGKVIVPPGNYYIADLVAMIKALEKDGSKCVPHKDRPGK